MTGIAFCGALLAMGLAHTLADHGGRDHLLWTLHPSYYLDEVAGVRGGHLLGFEVGRETSMRITHALHGVWTSIALVGAAFLMIRLGMRPVGAAGLGAVAPTAWAWWRDARRARGRSVAAMAIVTAGYATSALVLGAGLLVLVRPEGAWASSVLVEVLLAMLLVLASQAPVTLAARVAAKSAIPTGSPPTSSDAVLLLRSFGDDRLKLRSASGPNPLVRLVGSRQGFEAFIADVLSRSGMPLVAIGRPGERLPPLGATRTYVADEVWQGWVKDAAQRARLIVLLVGGTRGLEWEVNHLRAEGLLDKTLFLVPPLFTSDGTERRIEQLLRTLGVPSREYREVDWSMPTICGFYIARTGHLGVIMCDGRDYVNYALTIQQHSQLLASGQLPARPGPKSYANFANDGRDLRRVPEELLRDCSPAVLDALNSAVVGASHVEGVRSIDVARAVVLQRDLEPKLDRCGVDITALAQQLTIHSQGPAASGWYPRFPDSDEGWRRPAEPPMFIQHPIDVLTAARTLAHQAGLSHVTLTAVVHALLNDGGVAAYALGKAGVTAECLPVDADRDPSSGRW